jgi:hypothetical protein
MEQLPTTAWMQEVGSAGAIAESEAKPIAAL